MSSKGRQIAKTIGKSIKKKFEVDFFQFPFGYEEQQKDLTFLPQGSPTFSARKIPKMQSSPRSPRKSNSLSTITATEASDPSIVDHDEIIALTHDVKKFSDSLARLKALFTEGIDEEDDARVVIHEILGEVLSVLNPVMQTYPALQSPDIFTAARGLITKIKDHNYEEDVTSSDLQLFCEAIDQLALAFSSSVSEYLMGDMGPQVVMDFKTKSMNNIAGADDEMKALEESEAASLVPGDLDALLVGLESGLSLALQRAKVWSKYLHDIISYMEKKAQLEYDYAKNLGRLAHSVQNSLKKEGFLPLQSVYCTALSHDEEFVSNLQSAQSFIHRFIEPLSSRRSDHDKVYKSVKESWHRECRKMTDSVTNLRKSQALYHSRQQDLERARELALKAEGDKVEKKKKAEEESLHKTAEAETTYKACVAEANYRQQELFKVKGDLLGKIREQIELCDQVIKNVTVEYFHLYHSIVSPLPLQCQTLSESSKTYAPGSQYSEYVRRLPPTSHTVRPETFVFEPYIHELKPSSDNLRKESVHSNGSVSDHAQSPDGSPIASPRRDKYRIPVKAWDQHQALHSDTDSASCSSKSHESSPSGSPQGAIRRHLINSQSLDELKEEDLIAAANAAASFSKDKTKNTKRTGRDHPSSGIPGLMLHHRSRGSTTFGVDFQEQVDTFHTKVPPIVSKCLAEIENRGLMIKGIYRVSGVKSKVEHLCQRFDIDPECVSLEDVHPNIISNVLKLYLRQLPEPLLTFRLYPEFIHAAKDNMSGQLIGEDLIHCLHGLVKNLPSSNLRTCAVLMHHLQRVADHSELNQMSSSNLGIVFGPTLLRPLEGSASLASLVDTPHQTRAIELLITHAHLIFGPSEDFQVAPSQTPIETLDQALSDVILPGKSHVLDKSSMPAKTKSATIDSDDSSLSVSESSSAHQPTASEYTLPGSADFEQFDATSTSLSLAGLDLDSTEMKSDEDDDLLEISLPDKSKPQSDALSVPLSPQSISGTTTMSGLLADPNNTLTIGGGLSSKMAAVPKSASAPAVSKDCVVASSSSSTTPPSMPSSKSAPTAMSATNADTPTSNSRSGEITVDVDIENARGEVAEISSSSMTRKSRFHESHSTGDLLEESSMLDCGGGGEDGENKKYTSGLLTGKKKPHSQKLENIKFLTRAPSVDEVTNIMDELIIKSGGISPLSSPGQGSAGTSSPLPSSSSPMAASSTFFESTQPATKPSITPKPKSNDAVDTVDKSKLSPVPAIAEVSDGTKIGEHPIVKEEDPAEPVWVKHETVDECNKESKAFSAQSRCKVGSSRKSILEEIPIPTVNKPRRRHGTSDGGAEDGDGEDDQVPPVTIPASPTIKRREIPTASKMPSSPLNTRSASSSSTSSYSYSSSQVKSAAEKFENRADRFRQEQRKLVSAIKSTSSTSSSRPSSCGDATEPQPGGGSGGKEEIVGLSAGKQEEVLSAGCAMASQSVTKMEEIAGSLKEVQSITFSSKKTLKSELKSRGNSSSTNGGGKSPLDEKSKTLPGKNVVGATAKVKSKSILSSSSSTSSTTKMASSSSVVNSKTDQKSPRSKSDSTPTSSGSGGSITGSALSSGLSKKSSTPSSPDKASPVTKAGLAKSPQTSVSASASSSSSSSPKRGLLGSSRTTTKSPTVDDAYKSTSITTKAKSSSASEAQLIRSSKISSEETNFSTPSSPSTLLKSTTLSESSTPPTTTQQPMRLRQKSGEHKSVSSVSSVSSASPASSPSRPARHIKKTSSGTGSGVASVSSAGSSVLSRQSATALSPASSPKGKSAHLPMPSTSPSPSSTSSSPVPVEPSIHTQPQPITTVTPSLTSSSSSSSSSSSPSRKLSTDRSPRFV